MGSVTICKLLFAINYGYVCDVPDWADRNVRRPQISVTQQHGVTRLARRSVKATTKWSSWFTESTTTILFITTKTSTQHLFTRRFGSCYLVLVMSGNSLASVFYWTIYKRGDTEGKTLMDRSHTILKQYGLTLTKAIFNDVFRINNKSVIYEQYSYGQNGLVDSLRAIFNDFTFENQRYAKMLLRL